MVPLLVFGELLVLATNSYLQVMPFMMWLSAGTLFGMVFAIVALALAVGATYPNLDADNAAKVAASAGGLVYMILCMSFIGAVVVLEAWPVYAIFSSRFTPRAAQRGDAGERRRVVRGRGRDHRGRAGRLDPHRHQAAGSDRAVTGELAGAGRHVSLSVPAVAASRAATRDGRRMDRRGAVDLRGADPRDRRAQVAAVARVGVLEQSQAVGVQPIVQDHGVVQRPPREPGVLVGQPLLLRGAALDLREQRGARRRGRCPRA